MLHAARSRRAGSGGEETTPGGETEDDGAACGVCGGATGRLGARRSDELRSRHIMRLRGGCVRRAGRHLCPAAAARRFWNWKGG